MGAFLIDAPETDGKQFVMIQCTVQIIGVIPKKDQILFICITRLSAKDTNVS